MNKILVPFDFSDSSHNALDYAFFLAETLGSQITVLHVLTVFTEKYHDEVHLRAIEEALLAMEKEHKEKLDSLVNLGETRGLTINSNIIKNVSVPGGIIDYLESGNFDAVVIGNRGKPGISNLLLGRVTEKIIRLSPVPVLSVPKDWVKRELKTVLVPVDFSEGSRLASKQANKLLGGFHAKLKFIFVIEEDDYPESFSISFHFENKENQKLKNEILNALIDFTGIPQDQAEYIIRVGQPHDEIKVFVEGQSIDLITMPRSGQSLFEKSLMGSTTERMIRISPCPVLTVPFSLKNTSKIEYHLKFIQFLAKYKFGMGRSNR